MTYDLFGYMVVDTRGYLFILWLNSIQFQLTKTVLLEVGGDLSD